MPDPVNRPALENSSSLAGVLRRWRWHLAVWLLLVAGVSFASHRTNYPLNGFGTLWCAGASLGLGWVAVMLRRVLAPDRGGFWEYARLLSLPVVAGWLFAPFLTSNLVGGLDARWYGYVMVDALQQARAGMWPVFVGQGEFMYNGAIHPYRTAPYYTNLGISLDFATFHVLSPLAIQHLVVFVTATLAAVVSYASLSLLLGRRWMAWLLALIYVSGPAVALYIYGAEMYMTFCALAWMPLAVYGNVRLVQRNDLAGWICVAAGLALVWHCHAPVGAWATMFTAAVQGFRLLTRDFNVDSWARACAGVLLFGGLTGYYFISVVESLVARPPQPNHFALYALSLGLASVSLVRRVASGGGGCWLAGGALGLIGLGFTRPQHAIAFALVAGFALLLRQAERWFPAFDWRRRWPEFLWAGVLAAGLLTAWWYPERDSARAYLHQEATSYVLKQFPDVFAPISPDATVQGDLQPGYSALGLLALGLFGAAIFQRAWALRALVLVAVPLVAMLLPLPGITRLLYSLVPDPVYGFSSVGLWLRFFPLLINLSIFAGGLALVTWIQGKPSAIRVIAVYAVLGGALYWNYCEVEKPVQRGFRAVNSPAQTAGFYRSENAALYYGYDQLPQPGYMTSGILDYHLESRLLAASDKSLLPDPLLQAPAGREVTLKMHPNSADGSIYQLEPGLVIPPGERLLLRFDFLGRSHEGYLDIASPDSIIRRIYYLPNAGYHEKSFGVGPDRPKVLSLWNTATTPLNLHWIFANSAGSPAAEPSEVFARLRLQTFQPEDLQIKTRSLIPYRANVAVSAPAYLETPRVFIPGYRATVNGRPVPVESSPDYQAMIRLEPGANQVEMTFRATWSQWLALGGSAATWLGLLAAVLWRLKDVPS